MCIAIPVVIESIGQVSGHSRPALATTPDGGHMEIDLVMVPEAVVGDYLITHSGYAVSRVTEVEARQALDLIGWVEIQGAAPSDLG